MNQGGCSRFELFEARPASCEGGVIVIQSWGNLARVDPNSPSHRHVRSQEEEGRNLRLGLAGLEISLRIIGKHNRKRQSITIESRASISLSTSFHAIENTHYLLPPRHHLTQRILCALPTHSRNIEYRDGFGIQPRPLVAAANKIIPELFPWTSNPSL